MALDSLDEFSRKYNETYFQYKNAAKQLLTCQLTQIDISDKQIAINTHSQGTLFQKYPGCLESIFLETPNAQYFNYNKYAIYLFKVPARQWKRGLCIDNHELYNPLQKLFDENRIYKPVFNLNCINHIFNPSYVEPTYACNLLLTKKVISVAIAPYIMLSLSPIENSDLLILWYKTQPVGFIQAEMYNCQIKDVNFEQEIIDEFRKLGITNWIN